MLAPMILPPLCDISKLSVNFCFSSLKAEEKRGGSGSHNWGTVKDELRSVEQQTLYLPRSWKRRWIWFTDWSVRVFWFIIVDLWNWIHFCSLYSELDQSNVTEDTPEGEEHPPADSENKCVEHTQRTFQLWISTALLSHCFLFDVGTISICCHL